MGEPIYLGYDAEFDTLARSFEKETATIGNPNQILRHPSVGQMLGYPKHFLIEQAIRYLDLDHRCMGWMMILHKVVGYSPVPVKDYGKVSIMCEHWKEWYRIYENSKT